MRVMSRDEALHFLEEGTRTGKLATIRPDGRPHVAPIWFVVDNEIVFTTGESSVKARNLRRDPRAAMTVDYERPPYGFVIVEGVCSLSDDLDQVRAYATTIGGRYMGADRAEEFGARNGVPGEVLVRLSIDKLIAMDDLAD